jgi:hypothetical protein
MSPGESIVRDMTDPNRSHITILADRSGSMSEILSDAQGGINAFVDEQKVAPGDCSLYFVEFDSSGYDVVHDGPIADCPSYVLRPRGRTPLLDSMGRAINETGDRLAAMPEDERPGHVFVLVQTDGRENDSTEFTLDAINAMIKRQESEWAWTFVFLATGPAAFAQGQMFAGTQMHAKGFVAHDGGQVFAAYAATSANVTRTRGGTAPDSYGADLRDSADAASS